jgi:hypothetical protein
MSSNAAHLPHLDAMTARGWTWNEEYRQFFAFGARDQQNCPILNMRVSEWEQGVWMANYGVPGIGYGRFTRRSSPLDAAQEAEDWLREVLAPLHFPWLQIAKATP